MNKKNEILGMPYGTARNQLIKQLMFSFVKELNRDICYRCGEKIETERELSIEHKESWQKSNRPINSFFDLEYTSFSLLSCNSAAPRKGTMEGNCTKRKSSKPGCNCEVCKSLHQQSTSDWWNSKSKEERVAYRRKQYLKEKEKVPLTPLSNAQQ